MKDLLLLTMSLYRFFAKADIRTYGTRNRGARRPPNLNPPIFVLTLVGANPPNLMPAKFSGCTVYVSCFHRSMILSLDYRLWGIYNLCLVSPQEEWALVTCNMYGRRLTYPFERTFGVVRVRNQHVTCLSGRRRTASN